MQGRPPSRRRTSVASLTSDAFMIKFEDWVSVKYHGAVAPMLSARPLRELLTTSDAEHETSNAAARSPRPPSPPVTTCTPDYTTRQKQHARSKANAQNQTAQFGNEHTTRTIRQRGGSNTQARKTYLKTTSRGISQGCTCDNGAISR